MLTRKLTLGVVERDLKFRSGATMTVTDSAGTETVLDAAELAAINSIGAADLAKIDGITNGTGAAGKALVLDASGNVAMPDNGAIALSRAAVAAAGTGASDATVLADQVNAVTGSNGTVGVALPAAATTTGPIFVINTVLTSGADLKVYPVSGGNDNINGGAEDAAFTMGPGKAAWFIPTSATQWYVEDAAGVLTTTAEANILDGVTASAAELNYNDITTLGTLAASKAWTSDASLDTIMPTGGKLTVQSGGDITLESGSTLDVAGTFEIANVAMTASAAELNYNDITTLGTLEASKTWTSDASLDTVMPTGGLLTVQSGGAVTMNTGSTLTNDATTVRTAVAAEHGAGAIGTSSFGAPQTRRWVDGGIIVTQIKVDLTGLASVATANDVIGLSAGGEAYIGRNVVATNGVIFKTSIAVLETPAGGDNDVNVVTNASAVLAYDGAGGTTYLVGDLGDLTVGKTVENLSPALTEGDYFYLTAGTGDTAAAYTAGQYIVTLYGHAVL